MKNITYKTTKLAEYFANNRISWEQFYDSEKKLIEKLQLQAGSKILDIGCGCGGLGIALHERFGINNYTGVEINELSAKTGKELNPDANIICGDILDLNNNTLHKNSFDVVFSLSCVDWNVCFDDMLQTAWEYVKPGGSLFATFRLTPDIGCSDISCSYQYIDYSGKREGEIASYVVLNANDILSRLKEFNPSEIHAYGYWGLPSATAVTPYSELCFSAFSVKKQGEDNYKKKYLRFGFT